MTAQWNGHTASTHHRLKHSIVSMDVPKLGMKFQLDLLTTCLDIRQSLSQGHMTSSLSFE